MVDKMAQPMQLRVGDVTVTRNKFGYSMGPLYLLHGAQVVVVWAANLSLPDGKLPVTSLGMGVLLVFGAIAMARVLPLLFRVERPLPWMGLASAALIGGYAVLLITGNSWRSAGGSTGCWA